MTTMNAKILGMLVFVLVPSLALAQSRGQMQARIDTSGTQASERGPWLGLGESGANGSDGNGCITPSRGESDANAATAPSSKPPIVGP